MSHGPLWLSSPLSWLVRRGSSLLHAHRQSRLWHELAHLSDHQLNDAGLCRIGGRIVRRRSATKGAPVRIRDCREDDIPDIQRIYAHHVLYGSASFEEIPPAAHEMLARRAEVLRHGLPYLVADYDGVVVGYGYAAPYRTRSAYRYTVENSVYVADGLHRHGIGSALLSALIARCERGPWRQMITVIGDSANRPSIGLHERFGFDRIGVLRAAGWKFNRWTDSVLMQRALNTGHTTPPL